MFALLAASTVAAAPLLRLDFDESRRVGHDHQSGVRHRIHGSPRVIPGVDGKTALSFDGSGDVLELVPPLDMNRCVLVAPCLPLCPY